MPHTGFMFETQNVPEELMKKLALEFGFAQGELWFGVVVCDEQHERVLSGAFEGELVLISKRHIPRRKVRIVPEKQEITVLGADQNGFTISYNVRSYTVLP